jgi:hypothetical protein
MAFPDHRLQVLAWAAASGPVKAVVLAKARDRASVLGREAVPAAGHSASEVAFHHQLFFHASNRSIRKKRGRHDIKARSFLKRLSNETGQ